MADIVFSALPAVSWEGKYIVVDMLDSLFDSSVARVGDAVADPRVRSNPLAGQARPGTRRRIQMFRRRGRMPRLSAAPGGLGSSQFCTCDRWRLHRTGSRTNFPPGSVARLMPASLIGSSPSSRHSFSGWRSARRWGTWESSDRSTSAEFGHRLQLLAG